MHRFLQTRSDFGLLLARLALGIVMLPHGAQKLLGWFGGDGFEATVEHFTGTMELPYWAAVLVVVAARGIS